MAEAVRWDLEKWGGIEFFHCYTEPFPYPGWMLMRSCARKRDSNVEFSICECASHGRRSKSAHPVRIKEVARSGAIFERTGESGGIQGGTQWLAAPGLMLCAYGRVEGLSRGGAETHSCVKEQPESARGLYDRYSQRAVKSSKERCQVRWQSQAEKNDPQPWALAT